MDKEYCKELKKKYENLTAEQKVTAAGIGGLVVGVILGALLLRRARK